MQVIGTIFTKPNQFGDFNWMILNPEYDNSLFIFNDNEEHHNSCRQGGGNAIIRKYNKYSSLDTPRSVGIPTGTMALGGYRTFNQEIKNKIDNYFEEIIELVNKYKYTTIYYSSELSNNGLIGTSIFKVNHKVLEYITWKIHSLSTNPIKIIKCIKSFKDQVDESYFDDYESDSNSKSSNQSNNNSSSESNIDSESEECS